MRPEGRAPGSPIPDSSPTAVVEIGRIVGRHGIRGDVKLLPHNPDSTIFATLTDVVMTRENRSERRRVVSIRPHKRVWLAHLEGVDTANDAEALTGTIVSVPRDLLPRLATGEVYYIELLGCPVMTEDGTSLGTVTHVFPTGSNDVCEVRDGEREYLIPLIADVVVRLDVHAPERILIIRAIPGLLDAE